MTNAWGQVTGHPGGVTSVKDLYYLSTGSTEEAIMKISEVGYKEIEIFDGNLMEYYGNKKKFSEIMERNNMNLLALYSGANFIYKEIKKEEIYKINKVASFASELGAKHLVVGGGAIRADGVKEGDYNFLAEGLDEIQDLAKEHGLLASYHPHLGTIVQAPEQLDKLMQLTSINLCPDTAHIDAGGGDSIKVVSRYVERIKYIHFKDYDVGKFLPLGEGKIDFKKIINILSENNFEGEITVEGDGYDGDPVEAAELSYRFLLNKV